MLTNLSIVLLLALAAISSADRNTYDLEEATLFRNPCTADDDKALEDRHPQPLAAKLSDQAYNAMVMMEHFRDEYAQSLQSQKDFDALLTSLEGKEWLRNFNWYQDEALPREKQIGVAMNPSGLETMLNKKSPEVMPKMYKALSMILGSFMELKEHGLETDYGDIADSMKKHIDDTITALKSVLCTFHHFMAHGDIPSVTQGEIPTVTKEDSGLLYRDTLNFLDYLSQVFRFISDDIFKHLCEIRTLIGIPCTPDYYGPEYELDSKLNLYIYPYNLTVIPLNKTNPN